MSSDTTGSMLGTKSPCRRVESFTAIFLHSIPASWAEINFVFQGYGSKFVSLFTQIELNLYHPKQFETQFGKFKLS